MELAHCHRGKQGQENAFKGPLLLLDLHHPPGHAFHANRAFYTAGRSAQMLLVGVQYHLLPTAARKRGLRPIIRDLIRCAGRLARHARGASLLFSKSALRLDWLGHAADRMEAFAPG